MIEAANPMGGPSELADLSAATTGLPLADFECRHGFLPDERCPECEEGS